MNVYVHIVNRIYITFFFPVTFALCGGLNEL